MEVITAGQARAIGLTSKAIRYRIATGRWRQIHPRTYWTGSGEPPPLAVCRAALLYAGRGAVLSHETALALHGMGGASLLPVHVTISTVRRVDVQPGLVLHRSSVAGHDTSRRGLACHRAERALLDVASASPARAGATLAAGVQEGLTTPERLRTCLAELVRPLPGRAALARIVADLAGGTRSELERLCLRALRRAGLPEPVRDHEIVASGRRARLDLCYPEARIAVEVDGRGFHLGSADWQRDLDRQNAIVLAGWLVLRFTGDDVRHRPDHVVDRVRTALALTSTA